MNKTKNLFTCDSCQEKKSKESISFWDDIPISFDYNSIGPIILENFFIKIARSFKIEVTRNYILFQNHLAYKSKLTKKYKKMVKLDSVIFDTKISNNNKTFSLILKTSNLEIELMTKDKKQYEIWEIQLSKIKHPQIQSFDSFFYLLTFQISDFVSFYPVPVVKF